MEAFGKSVHDNQEKVMEMNNLYKELCKNYEELEAAKLIVDERLVQSEENLAEAEEKNQQLLEKLVAREGALLVKVNHPLLLTFLDRAK